MKLDKDVNVHRHTVTKDTGKKKQKKGAAEKVPMLVPVEKTRRKGMLMVSKQNATSSSAAAADAADAALLSDGTNGTNGAPQCSRYPK